jgi:hypothetical protein
MSAMFSSSADAESKRKADELVRALVGMGVPSKVEPRATLAVLKVSPAVMARLAEPDTRRAVLELSADAAGDDAALLRD